MIPCEYIFFNRFDSVPIRFRFGSDSIPIEVLLPTGQMWIRGGWRWGRVFGRSGRDGRCPIGGEELCRCATRCCGKKGKYGQKWKKVRKWQKWQNAEKWQECGKSSSGYGVKRSGAAFLFTILNIFFKPFTNSHISVLSRPDVLLIDCNRPADCRNY